MCLVMASSPTNGSRRENVVESNLIGASRFLTASGRGISCQFRFCGFSPCMVRCELIRFELHKKVCLQSTTNGHHGI